MLAVQQRVDHRVLEVRTPPPGHQARWLTVPPLGLEIRPYWLGEPRLQGDDGAIEVEHTQLYRRLHLFERPHSPSIGMPAYNAFFLATSRNPAMAPSIVRSSTQ